MALAECRTRNRESPVSQFKFTWIDLALTSLLANQPVASESGLARDQCLRAVVTPQVNLSFSIFIEHCRQLTVSIVVSPYSFSDWLTVFCLAVLNIVFTGQITNSNCLQTQTVTPGSNSFATISKFGHFTSSLHDTPVHSELCRNEYLA